MNIDLLMNGQAEAVSLSEQGMTITEYLSSLIDSDDTPATMMVNTANGEVIRKVLPYASDKVRKQAAEINEPLKLASSQMRITINDMLTDNDVLLFRAKPKTQGVGIGEALQELLDENNILPTSHGHDYTTPRNIYPDGEPQVSSINGDEMRRLLGEVKS